MKAIISAALSLTFVLAAAASQARPEYARREMKPCGYCHVNNRGGGPRNARGMYYQAHNLSFEGYKEPGTGTPSAGGTTTPSTGKKTGPPAYLSAWKVEVPAGTARIGVGSLTDDGNPRMVTMGSSGPATIYTVSSTGLTKEATVDLGAGGKAFVIGKLAKGKPAVIVAPGVMYYRDGASYVKQPVDYLKEVTGVAKFADGLECVYSFSGAGAPESWTLDNGLGKPLTEGRQLVPPEQGAGVYSDLFARLPAEIMANLGVPEGTQKIGVLGAIDPRGDGKFYSWMPAKVGDDYFLIVANSDALSITGQPAPLKPVWKSPALSKIIDVATGMDPKGSKKTGFFVLQATGADGKGRTVEFFALD